MEEKIKARPKIIMPTKRTVFIKKLEDTQFDGNHPNGINVGYERKGTFVAEPKIGERFCLLTGRGVFGTSNVTKIVDSNTFHTENSVYYWRYAD
jgi:hypothetical protein